MAGQNLDHCLKLKSELSNMLEELCFLKAENKLRSQTIIIVTYIPVNLCLFKNSLSKAVFLGDCLKKEEKLLSASDKFSQFFLQPDS